VIARCETCTIRTTGKGTYPVTRPVEGIVAASGATVGQANIFLRHTSASLVIMENADPTARADLHRFFDRLVPENEPWMEHTCEGPDDMPSHLRMVLTGCSLVIPILAGRLALGTWQGIFLFEHRASPHTREIVVSVLGQ
jgi:secondary thiamine-phosphate synthase enzyme